MKRTAYLINTVARAGRGRGGAGLGAAASGRLAGAALDVYEHEPIVHPDLLALENVLLIPHLASATTETRTAMADLAVSNALAVLGGPAAADAGLLGRSHVAQPRTADCAAIDPERPGPPSSSGDADARAEIDGMELPAIEKISESQQEDPFQILIATLLSARTQDATTHAASTRLFRRARTPTDDGEAVR